MPHAVRAEIRDETRSAIIGAFLKLYETKPFDKISVQNVIELAGYGRTTFYRYFRDMDDLFWETVVTYTAIDECQRIIDEVDTLDLEDGTDWIADFYDDRKGAVRTLCLGNRGSEYIQAQAHVMNPMFYTLINRGMALSKMQLEYVSEYVARSKAQMIELWVRNGQEISLNEVNRLMETVVERAIWTSVAIQSPQYGGPAPKIDATFKKYSYPWEKLAPRLKRF